MRDLLGPGSVLGYCANVHAAHAFDDMMANLDRHAVAVRERLALDGPMGVGLWLPASVADEVERDRLAPRLRAFLEERGLLAFTINGFPFGDFHADRVKHAVYRPTWAEPARLQYTLSLARLLAELIPDDAEGSISTLPLGWPTDLPDGPAIEAAAANLRRLAEQLDDLERRTGRLVHVDLEPEPGCVLETSDDVAAFFDRRLYGRGVDDAVRRHLGVCHDVCHAAVMFEPQARAIDRYLAAGVSIGKVQLSAAVHAPFDALDPAARRAAVDQLRRFDEPRYLHQTRTGPDEPLVDDLSEALARIDPAGDDPPVTPWRVHFHVPLSLEGFGSLLTTRGEVVEALASLPTGGGRPRHFEAETYAWGVLPEALKRPTLAEGIADELAWVRDLAAGGGEG